MSRENLTLDCPAHLFKNWEAADGRLSGLWLADNVSANQTVLSAVLLGTLVLVLCFTASNVYLRRTRSAAACVRRGFPGNNQVESTKVVPLISQTWMKWLSTLQRAFDPRWILRKCVFWGVSGPQVAGRGASKQDSINPCRSNVWPPEQAPIFGREVSASPPLLDGAPGGRSQSRSGKRKSSQGFPNHVAVIMDGHRRFGRAKYGDPLKGHSDGGKKLGQFLHWCMEAGVGMATAFAFSTENWKRDENEVAMLMDLVCKACGELVEDAVKTNMRIRVLSSDKTMLPERVLAAVQKAEHETRDCDGFLFNICLSYGARQEIAGACRKIAEDVSSGALPLHMVDEAAVERNLLTKGLPDPDVLIRTSGEKRVSNFLLYQLAYTELFFVDKLWPEVTQEDILGIFEEFKARERRFGS